MRQAAKSAEPGKRVQFRVNMAKNNNLKNDVLDDLINIKIANEDL
jgi:hypothetical protein